MYQWRYNVDKIKGNMTNFWLCITKGTIFSLCVVMVSILIFAFIVKWASLGENIINAVNQIIKIVAIFLGVWVCLRKSSDKYLYKGMLIGAMFSIFSFLLFSILNGSFSIDLTFVWDLIFATAIGIISAVISKILIK